MFPLSWIQQRTPLNRYGCSGVNPGLEKTQLGYKPILLGRKTSVKIDDRADANQLDGRLLLQPILDS